MYESLPLDSPMLVLPAKRIPDTRRARLAPVYKGGFAAIFFLFTLWYLIQQMIIDLTYHGPMPPSLQLFLNSASWGSAISMMAALYLILAALKDKMLYETFRGDLEQMKELPVKIATLGCYWWYSASDCITYIPSLSSVLQNRQRATTVPAEQKSPSTDFLQQIRARQPIKDVIISIAENLTLLIIGRDETRVSIPFKLKSYRAAFILYLALVGHKSWVLTADLLNNVYFAVTRGALHAEARRTLKLINEALERQGLRPMKLYRSGKTDGHWAWRIKRITLDGIEVVLAMSSKVANLRAAGTLLPLEESWTLAVQIMERQVEMYLVPLLNHKAYQRWLKDVIIELRQKRLLIIEYIAECEYEIWQGNPNRGIVSLQHAAQAYEWCMRTAMTIVPDQREGERYYQLCKRMYRLLNDVDAVARIERDYRDLRNKL